MAIYKKGNRWYSDHYVNGRRRRKSIGSVQSLTRKDAEKIHNLILSEIYLGKYNIQKKKEISFKDIFRKYLKHSQENHKSPSRVKQPF